MGISVRNGEVYSGGGGADAELTDHVAAPEAQGADLEDRTKLYHGVEYIESMPKPDTAQYIDTGVYATQNTRLVMDMQVMATTVADITPGYRYAGDRSNTTTAKFYIGCNVNAERWRVGYGAAAEYLGYTSLADLIARHTVELGQNKFSIDGEVKQDFGAQTFTTGLTLTLFNQNAAKLEYFSYMRLYSCQIYEGDDLVRDFAPAIHEYRGFVGLYDKVTKTFFPNLGTGSFTAGADTDERW